MPEIQPQRARDEESQQATRVRKLSVIICSDIDQLQQAYSKTVDVDEVHVLAPSETLDRATIESSRVRYWAAKDPGQVNWCLSMIGSPDVIYDVSQSTQTQREETFRRAFLHLAPGGYYVTLTQQITQEWRAYLLSLKLSETNAGPQKIDLPPRDKALVPYVGDICVSAELTSVQKTGRHILKIRDAEATRLLKTRNVSSTVNELTVRPGYVWKAAQEIRHYGCDFKPSDFAAEITVPPRYLRAYTGDVEIVERCLSIQGNVALPQTFRFHLEGTLNNPRLRNVSKDFATIKNHHNFSANYLPGTYYDVDCSNSGHFGHLTTEVISRLWGWQAAKALFPELKLLFRIRRPGERHPELELLLFQAYGIEASDIAWVGSPVRVDRLIAATPEWHNQIPHYADKSIAETWDKLKLGLAPSDVQIHDRIFVSRKSGLKNRACLNTSEVEAVFRDNGFAIIYPEEYGLNDQARIFENSRVVAGFAGSALFNLMFAKNIEHLIVLSHEAYTARNEHLYSSVLNVPTSYFWSKPQISHPVGGWSEEAYFSNWEFDFKNLGSALMKEISA